ncbi:hypothetical protein U1Q18_039363, partial [Sarracenia purpurea var. burkii]
MFLAFVVGVCLGHSCSCFGFLPTLVQFLVAAFFVLVGPLLCSPFAAAGVPCTPSLVFVWSPGLPLALFAAPLPCWLLSWFLSSSVCFLSCFPPLLREVFPAGLRLGLLSLAAADLGDLFLFTTI